MLEKSSTNPITTYSLEYGDGPQRSGGMTEYQSQTDDFIAQKLQWDCSVLKGVFH